MGKKKCFTCCIVIFIIIAVIGGAAGYLLAYIPDGAKMVEKFTDQELRAVYVGNDGTFAGTDSGLQFAAGLMLVAFDATYTDVDFTGIVYFVSETEGDEEPELEGCLLYTDSIKSAALMTVNYYKDGGLPSNISMPSDDLHASVRGKAFFIGDMNAEIALRKIIF